MSTTMQADWWLKSLAGVLGGFGLALGLVGLWAWWGPGGLDATDKGQFNMWLIAPLWMASLAAAFFARNGRSLLLRMVLANLLVHGALYWGRP